MHNYYHIVFKPIGWTSTDVVSKLKRVLVTGERERLQVPVGAKFKSKVKVGHGGTLDPLAEGILT
jgi:tRNA pseudouridine55 synthase